MAYQYVGNALLEWEESDPLVFSITEEVGAENDTRSVAVKCDLSGLRYGCTEAFLLEIKQFLVERKSSIAMSTLSSESKLIVHLMKQVIAKNQVNEKISIIDEFVLLRIASSDGDLSANARAFLKRMFSVNPHSKIFAKTLNGTHFAFLKDINLGSKVLGNILVAALSRSEIVSVLSQTEQMFESGEIDLDLFALVNLAFSVFARADSYRRIRISDLHYNEKTKQYFVYIPPAKQGVYRPKKICYPINEHVGIILLKQRQGVIKKYCHLVDESNIGRLSLFPAKRLKADRSAWSSKFSNINQGEIETTSSFNKSYLEPIRAKLQGISKHVSPTSLRHTIGTQLALAGCSSATIQAALKHASNGIAQTYVDIAFNGLIEDLSESIQPAFEHRFPVFKKFRSKDGTVNPIKAIHSDDLVGERCELTGECGSDIRCEAAPLTCYECKKFIPCYDADHSINLMAIDREISQYEHMGSPYRHLLEKAKGIKQQIYFVMNLCVLHQNDLLQPRYETHE